MKNRKTLRGNMTMGAISWLSGPPRDRGTAAGSSTDLIPGSDHQQVRRCAPHGSVPTQLGLQRIGFSFNQGARFVRSNPTMGKQRSRAGIHGYCNILLRRSREPGRPDQRLDMGPVHGTGIIRNDISNDGENQAGKIPLAKRACQLGRPEPMSVSATDYRVLRTPRNTHNTTMARGIENDQLQRQSHLFGKSCR